MKQYYFKTPFANAGDRADITRSANSDGTVSYAQGWGPDYQKDLETQANAKAVSRQVTNQLYWALTGAVQQYQQRGVPEWIAPADNDGTAFAYPAGATVVLNDKFWVSLVSNNTTQPGTGTNWQSLVYKVASQAMVTAGTDSESIVTPATLKADSDARIKTVNTSIANLTQTVAANKKAQEDGDTALSQTIASNKTATDKAIAATNAHTINGYRLDSNPVLSANDVKAIPLTGSSAVTGNIRTIGEFQAGANALRSVSGNVGMILRFDSSYARFLFTREGDPYGTYTDLRPLSIQRTTGNVNFGSQVNVAQRVVPQDYGNFDERYGAKISQNNNGYWRDQNTGFTIVWGIVDTSANNDYSTINFHRAFTNCFSVTCDVYGSQATSETSDKNPVIKGWTGTGFTVYAGQVEKQLCYQAFGYSAA